MTIPATPPPSGPRSPLSRQVSLATVCVTGASVGRMLPVHVEHEPLNQRTVIVPPNTKPIVLGAGPNMGPPNAALFAALRSEHEGAVLGFSTVLGVASAGECFAVLRSLLVLAPDGFYRAGILGVDPDDASAGVVHLGAVEGRSSPESIDGAYHDAILWIADNAKPALEFIKPALCEREAARLDINGSTDGQ